MYKDIPKFSARTADLQGPEPAPSPRELDAFRAVEADDQVLFLGRVVARATVMMSEGAVRGFRRLLARLLPEQDAAQAARGLSISLRAFVIDAMPAPGLLLRLVMRRRTIDVLLVVCDPRRLVAFGVAPLPLMPDAGDGVRLGGIRGEWGGRPYRGERT